MARRKMAPSKEAKEAEFLLGKMPSEQELAKLNNEQKEFLLKKHKAALLEEKLERVECLPHLYGMKMYPWMRQFFEDTRKDAYLCAGNQLGKSSIQARKVIEFGTNKDKWASLWRTDPRVFWYLYPTKEMATIEIENKWMPDLLPRGRYRKSHPWYGWDYEIKNKEIHSVTFNSGVTIFTKSYTQDVSHLQGGSAHYIGCDEELLEDLYDELNFRRMATGGYFSMAFTATLGQELWRRTIEERGELELFKDAFKMQVSMFDCQKYEDGSPSHWTNERIMQAIRSCKSDAEVQKRIHGKFVIDSQLKYPSFSRRLNVISAEQIPQDWYWYAGVDLGSNGEEGHPPAIAFLAVRPDFKKAYITDVWAPEDEDVKTYTQGQIVTKYLELTANKKIVQVHYDYAGKDFGTIASQYGIPIVKADKSHDRGEAILNVLFKNQILQLFDTHNNEKAANEILRLKSTTDKRKAKDDRVDAIRYACTLVPWDWKILEELDKNKNVVLATPIETVEDWRDKERREGFTVQEKTEQSIEEEINEWNGYYED